MMKKIFYPNTSTAITFVFLLFFIHPSKSQTYSNVALQNNIIHTLDTTFIYGAGASFFDINNDDWDDITFVDPNDTLTLYINNQGSFVQQNTGIYLNGEARQTLWADYDNDGDHDLFISMGNGRIYLYNHDGNFNFQDVTLAAGLLIGNSPNYGINIGDFNKDGYLDFYLSRYSYASDSTNANEVNALFKNNGDGTFTNIAQSAGVENGNRFTFQGTWVDYDKDTWPDLYIINDRDLYHNYLFRNNGNETFTDVTLQSNTALENNSPMSNTVGDFDNDGDMDIYMSNTGGFYLGLLLANNGDGTFSEKAQTYNVAIDKWSWGCTWIDVDNDTYQDLYVTTNETSNEIRSYLYMNDAATSFIDSPQLFLDDHVASSFAVAKGDINNDGYADMAVLNGYGYNSFLWQSSGGPNNFVKISLEGTISNKMAIGTWVYVWVNGNRYTHYSLCGENYMSQSSQHHIFGLGQATVIDSVMVQYLSGIEDKYYNLAINEHYHFTEGETFNNQIAYNSALSFCNGDSVILDAGIYENYLWSTGANQRFLTVSSSGTFWVDVTNAQGLMIASDTLDVFAANQPQIGINASNISCFNQNDGLVILELLNQTSNYTILWNGGINGDTISNLSEGMYTYQYSDVYGCTATDSIYIAEPFDFNIQTLVTDATFSNLGSIQSIINGGTPPYSIYFNGNVVGNLIDSLSPGIYNFEVVDANQCSEIINFEILFITGINEASQRPNIQIYPNPITEHVINLSSSLPLTNIRLFNSLGQAIAFRKVNQSIEILDDYSGIIFIEIISNKAVYRYKMLVQ
jgi:hypothetical protein